MAEERKGEWIQTYTGNKFYILDPRPEDINITDIARSHSKECRFGGHCEPFYSVAQHCSISSDLGGFFVGTYRDILEIRMALLLHDSPEAYLKDFPRPIKKMFPQITEAQNKIQKVIFTKYGVEKWIKNEFIERVDNTLLIMEGRNFMQVNPKTAWPSCEDALDVELNIVAVTHEIAYIMFRKRFNFLAQELGLSGYYKLGELE